MLIFAVDASARLWRRGSPRRAVIVGGSLVFFIIASGIHSGLIERGMVRSPYLISWFYLAILIAMGHELTKDVFAATRLDHELRETTERMNLAASAANMGLWLWDIPRDDIWITEKGRELFGFTQSERINFDRFLQTVQEEDRAGMQRLVGDSLEHGGNFESEYRISRKDGSTNWVAGYGRVELRRARRSQPLSAV